MKAEYFPHERGRRRFLPVRPGMAHMIKGTIAREVHWKPLRFLGPHSGFWCYSAGWLPWHLCIRGRRMW